MKVFDSVYSLLDENTQDIILNLFQIDGQPKLNMVTTQKQEGAFDCGVFAIAMATALVFGSNPVGFEQSGMREHLLKCFEDGLMVPF